MLARQTLCNLSHTSNQKLLILSEAQVKKGQSSLLSKLLCHLVTQQIQWCLSESLAAGMLSAAFDSPLDRITVQTLNFAGKPCIFCRFLS
jgi:hypothetical protein